jgi:type IV secretory pathway protease TraF
VFPARSECLYKFQASDVLLLYRLVRNGGPVTADNLFFMCVDQMARADVEASGFISKLLTKVTSARKGQCNVAISRSEGRTNSLVIGLRLI